MITKQLKEIFLDIESENYCLIKFDKKTFSKIGSDLDFYCDDVEKIAKKIIKYYNKLILENIIDSIEIIENKENKHIYIDVFADKTFLFRFDLLNNLPEYKNINISSTLFNTCLEEKTKKNILIDGETLPVYLPEEILNQIIRYIEYVEYHDERLDKIKHLKYICKNLDSYEKRLRFFEKLEKFIILKNIPKSIYKKRKKLFIIEALNLIKQQIKKPLRKIKYFILKHI